MERTSHDWSFTEKCKNVGYWYYVNNYVSNVLKEGNKYSSKVDKYNVSVEFDDSLKTNLDDYICECCLHECEDNFCPHVYALLCYAFNVEKEKIDFNLDYLKQYKNLSKDKIKKEFNNKKLDIIDLDILGYNYEELFNNEEKEETYDLSNNNGCLIFGGLLVGLLSSNNKENTHNNDLESWQQDLVKKGSYDSTSFEEEDLEDDDYYFEDDLDKLGE